jgi:hypothetical protein
MKEKERSCTIMSCCDCIYQCHRSITRVRRQRGIGPVCKRSTRPNSHRNHLSRRCNSHRRDSRRPYRDKRSEPYIILPTYPYLPPLVLSTPRPSCPAVPLNTYHPSPLPFHSPLASSTELGQSSMHSSAISRLQGCCWPLAAASPLHVRCRRV